MTHATNFDQYSDCNNFLADKDMDLNFWPSFVLMLDIIQTDLQLSRPYSHPAVFIQIRQCQLRPNLINEIHTLYRRCVNSNNGI